MSVLEAQFHRAPIADLVQAAQDGKLTLAEVETLVAARDANWNATTGKASDEAAHLKRAARRLEVA